jgi:hypothetical protein
VTTQEIVHLVTEAAIIQLEPLRSLCLFSGRAPRRSFGGLGGILGLRSFGSLLNRESLRSGGSLGSRMRPPPKFFLGLCSVP